MKPPVTRLTRETWETRAFPAPPASDSAFQAHAEAVWTILNSPSCLRALGQHRITPLLISCLGLTQAGVLFSDAALKLEVSR